MKTAELKFRAETGQNAKDTKRTYQLNGEIELYTDEYVEWLESKAEINIEAIEALRTFVRLADENGLYLRYFTGVYQAANKLLKSIKSN